MSGVPNLGAKDWYLLSDQQQLRLEIKCTINKMHLNHRETISPTSSLGKIVLHKISPWCQKVWVPLLMSQTKQSGLPSACPWGERAKELAC